MKLTKLEYETLDLAEGLENNFINSLKFVNESTLELIWRGKMSVTETLDLLAQEGRLEKMYQLLTTVQSTLKTLGVAHNKSPYEVIGYIENGVFGMVPTSIPFDVDRERYPIQTSRQAALDFAEGVNV